MSRNGGPFSVPSVFYLVFLCTEVRSTTLRTRTMLDLCRIGKFQGGDQRVLFYSVASLDHSETSC
jgi:hypothetical protein